MAKKHDHWDYLARLFFLVIATLFIALLLPFIHSFVFGFWISLVLLILGSMSLGYLSVHTITHVFHEKKNEFLAGIIIPLPAVVLLYGVTSFMGAVNSALHAVGSESIFSAFGFHPLIASVLFFCCFNIWFLHHFTPKDKRMYAYYVVAAAVFAVSVSVVNVLLEFV